MPTTTWRDLADQLTPGQLEDLEEYDGEIDEIIASWLRHLGSLREKRYCAEPVGTPPRTC
jgi:hypothetical protein